MASQIAEDQRYALLEYVSHLTAKDYEATLNDLIVLGFIPKEIGEDPEKVCRQLRTMRVLNFHVNTVRCASLAWGEFRQAYAAALVLRECRKTKSVAAL